MMNKTPYTSQISREAAPLAQRNRSLDAPVHALLELKDFSFAYPDQPANALSDICMRVLPGSFTVLCGPSGCGKSTLLRQMKSMLQPHGVRKGSILFDGKNLTELDPRDESARIGFVMQDPDAQLVTDKVWHELAFGLESLGFDTPTIRLRVAEMASYFGIQGWFYRNVDELSGGQKQLLNLASVMAMHPSLLILDEPTSQLDPIAASDFLETIRKINRDLGTTILMTEHRLEDVFPAADQAILMDRGRILFTGTPRQTGLWMYENHHPMFQSMPAPLQIYAQAEGFSEEVSTEKENIIHRAMVNQGTSNPSVDSERASYVAPLTEDLGIKSPNAPLTENPGIESPIVPLTVREGRKWLDEVLHGRCNIRLDSINTSSPKHASVSLHDTASLHNADSTSVYTSSHNLSSFSESAFNKPINPTPASQSGSNSSTSILEMKDIWFRYDRELPDILKGVSMKLNAGEIYCLLGGNGTGKSTALSIMSRVRRPYRGQILLGGKDIRRYSDYELYREFLGVIPQNPQSLFVKKTVELELYEMIGGTRQKISEEFPIDMEKKEVVQGIAKLTHLEHLLDHHPYDLSGGEQQRLALAKILLLRPKLLLMDEPTKGMDACFKEEFAGILRKLTEHGITIFIISHDIEFCARYADRCGMFFDGNIVTENTTQRFFAGNSFYTTSVNRMVRHIWPDAIVPTQVLERLKDCKKGE